MPPPSSSIPIPPPRPSKSALHRALSKLEPILQHDGFAYTFTIVFILINLTVFFLGAAPAWRVQPEEQLHPESTTLRLARAVARGGGTVLDLNAALVILVAARSLMTYLRRTVLNMIVPFDKAMPAFHTLVGNALTVATVLHALAHAVRYSILRLKSGGFFGFTSLAISGGILTVCMLTMKLTSLKIVRKKSFETFYYVHSCGFIIFFVALLMHGSHNRVAKTWMYVLGPLVVYVLDRIWRLCHEKGSRLVVSRESAVLQGNDMVCLRIPRTFGYLAGQYCDIKVPSVSNLQWHPFTIASSPHESEMLFYIKVSGDWTRALYTLFKDGNVNDVSIHVRGPYGAPAQHVGQYEHVVLISGGVGATPMCSITKYAHHWILNYTTRGAEASNTVSAAFTRNQSVRGTPSVPGTPTRNPSVYASHRSGNASANQSRHMSRNQSSNLLQQMTRNLSRPMSRSGSGRLERLNSEGGGPVAHRIDRVGSVGTNDSVGIIIQEQRENQPYGPRRVPTTPPYTPGASVPPYRPEDLAISIPDTDIRSDDAAMQTYLETSTLNSLPDDYDEELGNPDLPIPDRRAQSVEDSPSVMNAQGGIPQQQQRPQTFEIIREVDSSSGLFDEDEEFVEETPVPSIATGAAASGSSDFVGRGMLLEDGADLSLAEGLELEVGLMYEQNTASNAYKMMGMSFGPLAMMRYLHEIEDKKFRSSMVRASMNMMQDAVDEAMWTDRVLFYLHSVTINWFLLWLMLLRFSLIALGNITKQFTLQQTGLGIFTSIPFNSVDLVLAVIITIPVAGAVCMEIYMHGLEDFLSDNVGNSFDLFVLVPLLIACMALHILNLASVGDNIVHVSKLTVFAIWPVLSLFLIWRIGRTIGSRVMLAQYFKSTISQTKSLDYIWVSKSHEDDSWLINELLPLAESNIVRLHRFITRHGPKTEPWMLDYEKIPIKTTYSRPDWDDVFGNLVERSKSGAVIGVFFCGPDSMARMIQSSAIKAMTISTKNALQKGWQGPNQNGPRRPNSHREEEMGFGQSGAAGTGVVAKMASKVRGSNPIRGISGKNVVSASGDGSRDAPDPTAYGCGVRISVRVENFN